MVSLAILALVSQNIGRVIVHFDRPTVNVSPDLYGIFFEEINCAGDGGLYSELVRNRSFEDAAKPDHWEVATGTSGSTELKSEGESHFLRLTSRSQAGVENKGYWGMALRKNEAYSLRIRARARERAALRARLVSPKGQLLGESHLQVGPEWQDLSGQVVAKVDEAAGSLQIWIDGSNELDLDYVSLIPVRSDRAALNGLREDLFAKLKELKPAFMRFPGGCWVEGETMDRAQRWKQTIGPAISRRTQPNIWGYQSTNGLGYHEYLSLCEALNAAPMFVVNCGMSHREVVPLAKMDEFVQDAVDAVEYANGDVSTRWGAERAKNGHPRPFNLKYLEIGNENGGPAYEERYGLIFKAVRSRFPDVKIIANVWGGVPTQAPVEIVDEHYYSNPEFFIQNANRYDSYDRKGPRVYVGEYAVTQGCGQGNLIAAVAEAAFMTGMERNSDHVIMASYAPLFANVNIKAWNPDLICFDSSRSYGTPSYYVQKLFSENRPDYVVRTDMSGIRETVEPFPSGGIGIGTWGTQAEFKDIRVVTGSKTLFASSDGKGFQIESGKWEENGGVIRQTSAVNGARAWIGDRTWDEYSVRLKARKLSGGEGFLITVGRKDKDNFLWFNVGGWGNSQHAIEFSSNGAKKLVGRQVSGSVETGRWYDLRVDISKAYIRAYIDGHKVFDEHPPATRPLHITAGKTEKGDLIVKLVNVGGHALVTEISFSSFKRTRFDLTTLTSGSSLDENSLSAPRKVYPKSRSLTYKSDGATVSPQMLRLPPYSVSILRSRL